MTDLSSQAEGPAERHGISRLVEVDNLDDRTEIFYLLQQLTIAEQNKFLCYVVHEVNRGIVFAHQPPHVLLTVTAESETVQEAYLDLIFAVAKYDIPVATVLTELVNYVRSLDKLPVTARQDALVLPMPEVLD